MKNIIGVHVSIANGVFSAFEEAENLGCGAMQIFTKSSNQWSAKKLSRDDVLKFKEEARRTKIIAFAHDSYLINLASPKSFILEKSISALSEELERCDELDIPYLIMHPGSHMGKGDEIGIKKVAESLNKVLDKNNFKSTKILGYSAKFNSNFYGPFRQAANSTPAFGDRSSYQLDYSDAQEALEKIRWDIDSGAGMVMVKPALSYLDIISQAKRKFNFPLAAYNVSAEYALVKYGTRHKLWDEKKVVREILTSIVRAGADYIITYHAKDVAKWIKLENYLI